MHTTPMKQQRTGQIKQIWFNLIWTRAESSSTDKTGFFFWGVWLFFALSFAGRNAHRKDIPKKQTNPVCSATTHYLKTDQTLSSRSLKRCLVCSLLPKIQMKIRPWGTAEKKAAFPILPQPLSCGWELGQLCFAFLNLYLCICICTVNMQWM